VLPDEERLFNPSRETRRTSEPRPRRSARGHPQAVRDLVRPWKDGWGQRKLWGIVRAGPALPASTAWTPRGERRCTRVCTSYRHVKALTEQLLADALRALDAPIQIELPLTQHHPLIREGDDYRGPVHPGRTAKRRVARRPTQGPTMTMSMNEIERALRRVAPVRGTSHARHPYPAGPGHAAALPGDLLADPAGRTRPPALPADRAALPDFRIGRAPHAAGLRLALQPQAAPPGVLRVAYPQVHHRGQQRPDHW